MKFRDFVDAKNITECLNCLDRTLTECCKKLEQHESFYDEMDSYYYHDFRYDLMFHHTRISNMDSVKYAITWADRFLQNDYMAKTTSKKKDRPPLFTALITVINNIDKLSAKYRKVSHYDKRDFTNLINLIEQLDKFNPNLETNFYTMLTCFDRFWYLDDKVDWRPNETTPEDYYAL